MLRRSRIALYVIAIALFLASPTLAQNITSSMLGQVTDPSGAAIPGAQVTITNVGTGVAINATTNTGGTYSVPNLLAGFYDVAASKEGFETYKKTGIQLEAVGTLRVDITLKVGATRQTVTVAAAATMVQTDSQTISSTLTNNQVTELPFTYNTVVGLLTLVAGAQTAWGYSNPQTGGTTHWGGNNFSLNGVPVNDIGNGGGAYAYGGGGTSLANLPGRDSLQEFKVETANMNAEYRDVGNVTMVTKQGTNQFHGELYEYLGNTDLNANTFLLNSTGQPRAPIHTNQFGVDIGGPIKKNKAWFFFNFGGMRQVQEGTSQFNTPTAAMRNGDFSALLSQTTPTQLYNPFTGQPFAGNQIPSNLITSQAKTLLAYVPLPTVAGSLSLPNGSPNYIGAAPYTQDVDSYVARGDYQLSPSNSLYAVYTHNTGFPWGSFLGYPSTYGNATNYGYRDQSWNVTENHVFGPSTSNELRVAWFDHASIRSGGNLDFNPASLFPQYVTNPQRGLPVMTVTGYGPSTGLIYDTGLGFYGPSLTLDITDNFTRVHGRHLFKAGVDELGYKNDSRTPTAPVPSFAFNGQWIGNKGWLGQGTSQGNALADFLLGTANTAGTGLPGIDHVAYARDWEFYGQDTWQATSHLTLYYGLRFMYQQPWVVRDNLMTYLDLVNNKLALPQNSATPTLPPFGASAALLAAYPFETTQSIGLPVRYNQAYGKNFGPRFGFAFRPFSNSATVIRGGYGIYYNFEPLLIGAYNEVNNPPWGGTAQTFSTQLTTGTASGFQPDLTFSNPFPANLVKSGVSANPTVYLIEKNFKNAQAQEWNLSVEHQFGANWVTRATYLGNKTDHLPWTATDINVPVTQTPSVTVQNQRPWQPWGTIASYRSGAIQYCNNLQLEAIKRISNGLSFQAEYQYTRSLDNVEFSGGMQNWHFPNADYGPTNYIRQHQLVFNYVWFLPVGRGQHFLSGMKGPLNAVLGGWEMSGITMYGTGIPFPVNFAVPSSKVGWWG
jgi:hypothetical protein